MLNKTDLRNAIAQKNRGLSATETDRQMIASAIAQVEDRNPTPDPLTAPELLAGDWRLLYTTSQDLLGIDRLPFIQLGNVYQCVRPDLSRIYNIAEIKGLPYCEGLVSVAANFEPAPSDYSTREANQVPLSESLSPSAPPLSKRCVNVRFNRAVLGLQRLLDYRSPAQFVDRLNAAEKMSPLQGIDFSIDADRQQGWLEITYLDRDLRIGRGNRGSLFVLTK
ncbi:PAP/fibrillin family protein [Leptolyngbya sp. BC1307]|uniref:PAP/fibrillin family protein n=1 Tax=Leptolyngbya sp. BC1307 TaxID=2029589 RepID=UPI000EFCA122|nr:PAP/fibrillin family protein [Leptolyngbya sp. BC1307]